MSIHEIGDLFHQYAEPTVKIVNIRIGLKCSVCGNEWGIRVEDEIELLKQAQKFICLPCYQKKLESKSVKGDNYDYTTTTIHENR